jgi:hypothetical protein
VPAVPTDGGTVSCHEHRGELFGDELDAFICKDVASRECQVINHALFE